MTPNVEILHTDVLKVNLAEVSAGAEASELVVVGNIPYYITSDILLWLFAQVGNFSRAVLMMQQEVAERITAPPGSSEYGFLSATTQLYVQAEKLFSLPPGAFSPPPKVDSGVVRLHPAPRFAELGVEPKPFLNFLRGCFQQKRKTLSNNLRASGYKSDQILAALQQASVASTARAEELQLESMAKIFQELEILSALKPTTA